MRVCAILAACLVLAAGELCVVVPLDHSADFEAARESWFQNETNDLVRFVKPSALRLSPTVPDGLPQSLQIWYWALRWLPQSCEWVFKVPSSAYVHLDLLRPRLRCLREDRSLRYLGFLRKEVPAAFPQIPVADGRAGIALRRSLLAQLPEMLERCASRPDVQAVATLGEDLVLGLCLVHSGINFAAFLDPNEVLVEDLRLHTNGRYSVAFDRVAREYMDSKRSLMKCQTILSGLAQKDMKEVHKVVMKAKRWHPGVACLLEGLVRPESKHGTGPLNGHVLDPRVQDALKDCFLSRAYTHWRASQQGDSADRPLLSAPQALAKEWIDLPAAQGKAFDRLRRGGHEVCVFVLTTSASEKHRADARAIYNTWARKRPAGVEVFMVKDNSWTLQDLTGGAEEADDVLTLRGDVDLGFLYNSVRSFVLWRYLAENHQSDCQWYVKVDGDTFVNLWALQERLQRYFKPSEEQYLGSVKHTRLTASADGLHFAVNAIVVSGTLLSNARTWLSSCFDDILWKRLGQGAEDIDLALCLAVHGYVLPQKLGVFQEMPSRNFAATLTGGSGGDLLNASGSCTILIHPIHETEMHEVYDALMDRRDAALHPEPCNWPKELSFHSIRPTYMAQTFLAGGEGHQCWDLIFNWNICCHERWGPMGNVNCWDEENTWQRCCNRTNAYLDPPSTPPKHKPQEGRAETDQSEATGGSSSTGPGPRVVESLGVEVFHVKNEADSAVVALFGDQPSSRGNPKCWKEDFSYDVCCISARAIEGCWAWPFTYDFCCYKPLAPRPPIRSGGLPGLPGPKGKTRRTSRCQDMEDQNLLACQLSLDEIGVLFELPDIGSGDKASGWHDYLGVYERFLLHLPLTSDVLEFGVRMGSSLAMWSEYFPNGTVVGVDKDLATFFKRGQRVLTHHGAFARGNVYVLEANASDTSGREKLQRLGFDRFDVIVDDANHWHKDQIARFELYFPDMLRPGGAYIIEDVHMQAPFTRDGTIVREYFTELTASVYLSDEILVGSHAIRNKRQTSQDWRHKVESVTFLRDMIAIAKAADAA